MSKFLKIVLLLSFTICFFACDKDNSESKTATNLFIHRSGKQIVDENNNPFQLKGVAFGNEIWYNVIPANHHNEADFARVKDMKMNTIRFYLNYKTFEDDATPYTYKQSGWDWIDKNIAWAKKYGIYLILNMHAPQGGYQSQGTGDALWNVQENQNRLAALWKAIAEKYKNETQIIGYGLVNEPVPTTSVMQWQMLAQKIVSEIRTVDANHIVFIEKAIYVKNDFVEDTNLNFPIVLDNNMVYEFHIYDPINYTHQLFDWANRGDGGKYPDENEVSFTNGTWYSATFNNPSCSFGTSDWTYYEGQKFTINDPKMKIGAATLVGANAIGKIYFDDIIIKEFDGNNIFVRNIMQSNLDDNDGWYFWSSNNSGASGVANIGYSNGKSLFIENTTSDCNLSNYSSYFVPKQGYAYQISGWMKGENLASNSACKLRIDFTTTNDPITKRNKQLLENSLQRYIDWSNLKNIPVYMGEFGVGTHCFQNNKGGLQWVTDMLDIAKVNDIHFTYHAYHENSFGLYYGDGILPNPNNANQALINLFKEKL